MNNEIDINDLTTTEQSVYSYILANEEKVSYMRIRGLAEVTHVSTATILRLVKKIGYDGFAEYRTTLKYKLNQKTEIELNEEYLKKFFDRSFNENYQKYIDLAVDEVMEADMVFFLGIVSSGSFAEYGSQLLSHLGIPTFSFTDPYFRFVGDYNNQKIAFIVLSASGETEGILDMLKNSLHLNRSVISITNTCLNTLSKKSDVNIAYHVKDERLEGKANVSTQIPVCFILETLARKVSKRIKSL
ncbi:MAG: MurR/RpiR family transcriptional regulator [Atopostipes sp.]|nr:MurR/RpiR family transcriptional regulator [Atopostipes sp.]